MALVSIASAPPAPGKPVALYSDATTGGVAGYIDGVFKLVGPSTTTGDLEWQRVGGTTAHVFAAPDIPTHYELLSESV